MCEEALPRLGTLHVVVGNKPFGGVLNKSAYSLFFLCELAVPTSQSEDSNIVKFFSFFFSLSFFLLFLCFSVDGG